MATEPVIRIAPIPGNPQPSVDPVTHPRDTPETEQRGILPAGLEPLAVRREQGAALFSIGIATWDRWDSSGLLGPAGTKKAGVKLWSLAELKEWAAAGMPCRKEWLARRAATNANGKPR